MPDHKNEKDTNEVEVTQEMVDAAEKALWEQALRFDMRSLDELYHDTIHLMIAAAISKMRTS